ncbi:hypothetical protein KXR53_16550 [Inquilinus limosus]|uniref:hypothetical protein n=1 Tax=Inquilinus limosus TaxID=171674 RepID=UPI003F14EAD7
MATPSKKPTTSKKACNGCVEEIRHKKISIEERGRKVDFTNAKEDLFRRIQVDNCLIKEGHRADWIVTKVNVGSVIVELKGKDVRHACKQLFATLESENCKEWLENKIAMLIICSRAPAFDSFVIDSKTRARKLGIRLTVKTNRAEYDIEELML